MSEISKKGSISAVATSILMHALLLVGLAMIQQNLASARPEIVLETIMDEDRVQEEFTKELETETEIAETQNLVAGGAVSTALGGSGAPAVAQQKIETSESLKEPDIQVNAAPISIPGESMIGNDLGPGEVNGEVGAVVEGYGAALSRITQELVRMMRTQKVMVVWLFDESESMKDDQKEIAQKFHKVYEELGIQQQKDKELVKGKHVLLTSILGFGKMVHMLTPKPTADINQIRAAIDKIAVDESGDENMCQSVAGAIDKFGGIARSGQRKLVVVVVSDESPTDKAGIEITIDKAKKAKCPVYILGREAIFGYPYARIRWKDPVFGLNHWVQIDRGPETADPECLQYNGIGARWDSFSSGFGPYSQVRLAKESGGIFFMLPGEEENLTGPGAHENRKFAALAMKEYQPLLLSRREYTEQRQRSEFRTKMWNIIVTLNPHLDKNLSVRLHHYSTNPAKFLTEGRPQFAKAMRAIGLLNQAIKILEDIEPLRAKEESQRWRGNYDLMLAQCLSYRVRLFQYLLVLDRHMVTKPKPTKPNNNEWNIGWNKKMIVPDKEQFDRLKNAYKIKESRDEYLAMLKELELRSNTMYKEVETAHAGTPWARRAQYERTLGYGMYIVDGFRDPRYRDVGTKIKIPKF